MNKGTEWTYEGRVEWEKGGDAMRRAITWTMRVENRETKGDLDIATMSGWPGDVAPSSEGGRPSTWLLVRRGSQYFKTESPLDVRTLNPGTLILDLPLTVTKNDDAMPSCRSRRSGVGCWKESKGSIRTRRATCINWLIGLSPTAISSRLSRASESQDLCIVTTGRCPRSTSGWFGSHLRAADQHYRNTPVWPSE